MKNYINVRTIKTKRKKSLLEADVVFLKLRIKQYEELLKISSNKNWWAEDMNLKELEKYFNRKESSIRKTIRKMCDYGYEKYKLYIDRKVMISKKGVE